MIKRTFILLGVIFMAVFSPYFIGSAVIYLTSNGTTGFPLTWICGALSSCVLFIIGVFVFLFIQSSIKYIKTGVFN